ncbi:uncharacterized protein LOC121382156 [Gigantopelta aegis]|uniref:uncharacterized protein LOC121382156 n=1 Tax=Gigantopelta aegis TaxID=1735272 RepID=UPI001B88AEDA|nr:uncharacterized protein LOC121382156 [Gigantopelta aegis]
MFLSPKIFTALGFVIIQEQATLVSGAVNSSTKGIDGVSILANGGSDKSSIENEVLGPLRVWHIVFLVCVVLLVIVVIVCCCVDYRIPRTRQEIEERYQKRIDNSKFVKYLDSLPDNAANLRLNKKVSSRSSIEVDTNIPKIKVTKDGNLAVATPLAGHPSKALAELAKRKQFGEPKSRPGQKAMATAMQSVPKPQITGKTRQSSNNH